MMKRKMRRSWRRKTATITTAILTVSFGGVSHAMPQGEVIRSGDATIQRSDDNKSMEETQSDDANKVSWDDSATVNSLLSSGTNVKIQSVDANRADCTE